MFLFIDEVVYKVFVVCLLVSLSFFLVVVLKVVSLFLAEVVFLSREEASSYECGFEHYSLSRVPFSLRYFFLTLIFLLFDLEIVLLLFVPSVVFSFYRSLSLMLVVGFAIVLFLGLLYE